MSSDLFDHVILCNACHQAMVHRSFLKEGFVLRGLECSTCHIVSYHPGDVKDFERFSALRQRQFQVKLRMVGNSFCISIPKEIVEFHHFESELDQLVDLFLQEPHKLVLAFHTNLYKTPTPEDA